MKEQVHKQLSEKPGQGSGRPWARYASGAALILSGAIAAGILASDGKDAERSIKVPPERPSASMSSKGTTNIILGHPSASMGKRSGEEDAEDTPEADPLRDDKGNYLLDDSCEKLVSSKGYKDALKRIDLLHDKASKAKKGTQLDSVENEIIAYFASMRKRDPELYEEFEPSYKGLLGVVYSKRTGQAVTVD